MSPEDEVLAPFVDGAYRKLRGRFDRRLIDEILRAALAVEPTKACETCEGTGRLCSEHERAYCPCDSLWIVCPDCGSSPAAGRVSDPEGVRLIVGQWAGAVTDKQFDFDDNLVGIVARGEGIAHADFGAAVFLAVAPETGSEKP